MVKRLMSKDEIALHDIVNAARLVTEYVQGFNKSSFHPDWKTRSAFLYQLTIIHKAINGLSKEFRGQHSQIPWSLMAGMSGNLVLGYHLIDWDGIWKIVKSDMPEFLSMIEQFLK
jgi:uncharacterized protein with HEPN domain